MVAPRRDEVNETTHGIGGWLLLLCALLLVYQPIDVAVGCARALDALALRGTPLALVLLARMVVAGVGIAAGIALAGCRRGAATFAKWSLALSAAMDLFIYSTSYVPNNRLPGTTPLFITLSLAYSAIWIAYLSRSARVRNTFPA